MTETELVEAVAKALEDVPVMCNTYSMDGEDAQALAISAIEAMQPAMREAELRGMKRMQEAVLAECEGFSEDMGWGFGHVLDAIKAIPLSLGGSDGAQN